MMKIVYFTPQLYRGVRAELLVLIPSGILYLGHLYAGESGQFRPLIFLGLVPQWCGPVWCFVRPGLYNTTYKMTAYKIHLTHSRCLKTSSLP